MLVDSDFSFEEEVERARPRFSGLIVLGAGVLAFASLVAEASGAAVFVSEAAAGARLCEWLAGPVGAWALALAVSWTGLDILAGRSWWQAASRGAGLGAAAVAVAAFQALPFGESPGGCFQQGGYLGSLLADWRAADLGWRLGGVSNAQGAMAAAAIIGFVLATPWIRGPLFGQALALWRRRGEIVPPVPPRNRSKGPRPAMAAAGYGFEEDWSEPDAGAWNASEFRGASDPFETKDTFEVPSPPRRRKRVSAKAPLPSPEPRPAARDEPESFADEAKWAAALSAHLSGMDAPAPEPQARTPRRTAPDWTRAAGRPREAREPEQASQPFEPLDREEKKPFGNIFAPPEEPRRSAPEPKPEEDMPSPAELLAAFESAGFGDDSPLSAPSPKPPTIPRTPAKHFQAPPADAPRMPDAPLRAAQPSAPEPTPAALPEIPPNPPKSEPRLDSSWKLLDSPKRAATAPKPPGAATDPFAKPAAEPLETWAPADWPDGFEPAPEDFFPPPARAFQAAADEELLDRASQLQGALEDFGVNAEVSEIVEGPAATVFELALGRGVPFSRVGALEIDLSVALREPALRIVPLPGKAAAGVELPSRPGGDVALRDLVQAKEFRSSPLPLLCALGVSVDGSAFRRDLAKFPHLLLAGAPKSGKSVCLNAILASIVSRVPPEMARIVLIEPKGTGLNVWDGVPHMAAPIARNPAEAAAALSWLLALAEERSERLRALRLRDLDRLNEIALGARRLPKGVSERPRYMPRIAVFIEELADLPAEAEASVVELARRGPSVGVHLVATARSCSGEGVTGSLKACFAARAAFRSASKAASRAVIDCEGAERLRGRGDMLLLDPSEALPVRVQAANFSDEDAERLADYLREAGPPWPLLRGFGPWTPKLEAVPVQGGKGADKPAAPPKDEKEERLYREAVKAALEMSRPSPIMLDLRLGIGPAQAEKLLRRMERDGFVERRDDGGWSPVRDPRKRSAGTREGGFGKGGLNGFGGALGFGGA